MADLNPRQGSVQSGVRPVVVLQNNLISKMFTSTVVAAISSSGVMNAKDFPSNAFVEKKGGLTKDSVVKLSQIMVVDSEIRFIKYLTTLSEDEMSKVEKAINFTLVLGEKCEKCGSLIKKEQLQCFKCKSILKKQCDSCKSILNLDWLYCPSCGNGGKDSE